jgi:hypothetical protein
MITTANDIHGVRFVDRKGRVVSAKEVLALPLEDRRTVVNRALATLLQSTQ